MARLKRINTKRYFLTLLIATSWMGLFGQSFDTNGSAFYLGGLCYELTPDAAGQVGSIFSNDAIDLNEPFTFVASMNFGWKDGVGADGIVFILTPNPAALGGGGGGIGFSGITPSIGVEFDTYQNANFFDPVDDHMAIMANGAVVHSPPSNLSGPIILGNIETGFDYCFTATWNPGTQTLTAGLNGINISYTGDIINNIFGGNPVVHFGFSSATGLAFNHHVICVVPVVPEPMEDVTICPGETVQLQADLNGLGWSWEPEPSLSNPNISNPVADPVTTTTYIVAVDYICNGIAYDTVTVTVNPDLSTNISNTGPECEGENITLMAWGGESYFWSGPNGFSSNQQNPTLFSVTTGNSGTYSVTIYDNNACMYVATTVVEVYPTPVINIVPPAQPFCAAGDPVQITATPSGGYWEGNIADNGVFNPVTAGAGDHLIAYYYTDGNNCSASEEIVVTVVPNTPATITPPGPFCEEDVMVTLSANPPGGTWSGIANASGQIFPNTLSPGFYTVSYALTAPTACYDTDIQIEIVASTSLVLPIIPSFCADDPDYQITGFEPPGGTWSGAASPDGIIQPQVLGPGSYQVTYTYTPPVCPVVSGTASFTVHPTPVVNIMSPGQTFCETGDPVQLSASPAGGDWEGNIGDDGIFDPVDAGVGDHVIGYNYTDGNNCSASAEVILTVVSNTPAVITPPGPFCEEDAMISLTANPPGGAWGGIANASGQIFPNTLSPGFYPVSYSLTTANACYDTEIEIEIVAGTTLVMPVIPDFCDNDPDYQLTGVEPPGGVWSGASDPAGLIEPQVLGPGMYQVTYTYTPPVCPVVSASAAFSIYGAPAVQNIERICDATATTYVVQFEITGGDPASYTVDGSVDGYVQAGDPALFISDPVPTGESYMFFIYDDNHCDTIAVTGSYSCNCITAAGSMNQSPIIACEGESITVSAATGYVLDPDDAIIYVLHTGNPFEYIVAGDGTTFFFEPPVVTGVTYFVDALIGNALGNVVDLNDPCLVNIPGPTVIWLANPTGDFTAPTDICAGDGAVLTFTMTGEGPFNIIYLENNTTYAIENVGSPYSITVYPFFNTSYTFYSVTDLGGNMCSAEIDLTIDVAVGEAVEMEMAYTICQGDSIFLQGAYQNMPGTYYDTLAGNFACDTFVTSILMVVNADTTYVNGTTCQMDEAGIFENLYPDANGCDSLVITTISLVAGDTTYQAGTTCDPAGAGTFSYSYAGADGCDSTVIVEVVLIAGDTTQIATTSCILDEVGVLTNTYMGSNGCDSTVIITVTYSEADTTYHNGVTCDEQQVGVFTDTYMAQNGCDSVVISTIELTSPDTTYVSGTTCDEQQAGIFSVTYAGQHSCDSVVITTITLSAPDTSYIAATTCNEAEVGIFTETYVAQNGCDSIVISTIVLTTPDTTIIVGTTCDEQQVGVFTDTYTGQNGCDSVVISTIALVDADTTYISGTTCDEQQAGVFTGTYAGQNGCDSVVISTIVLTTADTTYISGTTCDEQQAGVSIDTYAGQNGCDSIVISTIVLTTADTMYISGTTCDELQAGVFTGIYAGQDGCDSVVISTFVFTNPDTTYISGTTCDEQQAGVSIDTYTGQNGCDSIVISSLTLSLADTLYTTGTTCHVQEAGVFLNTYVAQNGCDSLVISTITLFNVDTSYVERTTCHESELGIFSEILLGQNGCDSIVISTIGMGSADTTFIEVTTCDEVKAGVYTDIFEAQNGCDSIVITMVSLLSKNECALNASEEEIFIPNAFSPNYDGVNDQFYIMAEAGIISDIQWLRIYDRWGGLVIEKQNGQPNDPEFGWDGTRDSELLNPGVFIWQAHLTYTDGVEKTLFGDVTLVR